MDTLSLTPFRACNICGVLQPQTLDFFYRRLPDADGLMAVCKTCIKLNRYARRHGLPVVKSKRGNGSEKRCTACYQMKSLDDFNAAPFGMCGRRAVCRHCQRKQEREYRQGLDRQEWLLKARAKFYRRRALKLTAGGSFDAACIRQMIADQDNLCAYCETELGDSPHVDHMVPLSRGGGNDWSNLAVTCASCNFRKSTKTTLEFMT